MAFTSAPVSRCTQLPDLVLSNQAAGTGTLTEEFDARQKGSNESTSIDTEMKVFAPTSLGSQLSMKKIEERLVD
jgi:hypothetical protein